MEKFCHLGKRVPKKTWSLRNKSSAKLRVKPCKIGSKQSTVYNYERSGRFENSKLRVTRSRITRIFFWSIWSNYTWFTSYISNYRLTRIFFLVHLVKIYMVYIVYLELSRNSNYFDRFTWLWVMRTLYHCHMKDYAMKYSSMNDWWYQASISFIPQT